MFIMVCNSPKSGKPYPTSIKSWINPWLNPFITSRRRLQLTLSVGEPQHELYALCLGPPAFREPMKPLDLGELLSHAPWAEEMKENHEENHKETHRKTLENPRETHRNMEMRGNLVNVLGLRSEQCSKSPVG